MFRDNDLIALSVSERAAYDVREALLPCPFCGGGNAKVETGQHNFEDAQAWCPDCCTHGPDFDNDPEIGAICASPTAEAIKHWNTRALQPAPDTKVREAPTYYQIVHDTAMLANERDQAMAPPPALDPVTVEACAKVCDMVAINASRRAAEHTNIDAKRAALDKMEAAQDCAFKIRERAPALDPVTERLARVDASLARQLSESIALNSKLKIENDRLRALPPALDPVTVEAEKTYDEGITFAIEQLAIILGVEDRWSIQDGSDDHDQDVRDTIRHVLDQSYYAPRSGEPLRGCQCEHPMIKCDRTGCRCTICGELERSPLYAAQADK